MLVLAILGIMLVILGMIVFAVSRLEPKTFPQLFIQASVIGRLGVALVGVKSQTRVVEAKQIKGPFSWLQCCKIGTLLAWCQTG